MPFKVTEFSCTVLVAVVLQLAFWDYKNCTARGEDAEPEISCPGGHFREYCPLLKPCCFYDGINHTCQAAKNKGEECTMNSVAYNTKACFCKPGLFCIDNTCTEEKPKITSPENESRMGPY